MKDGDLSNLMNKDSYNKHQAEVQSYKEKWMGRKDHEELKWLTIPYKFNKTEFKKPTIELIHVLNISVDLDGYVTFQESCWNYYEERVTKANAIRLLEEAIEFIRNGKYEL